MQGAETEVLESWIDRLAVTGLARRLCLYTRYRHGFYPLNNEIFLLIPVLDTGGEGQDYVSFLCTEKLLLTLHRTNLLKAKHVAPLMPL